MGCACEEEETRGAMSSHSRFALKGSHGRPRRASPTGGRDPTRGRDHPPRWSHLSAERRRQWDARGKRKKRAEHCHRICGSPSRAVTAGHGGPALPEVGTTRGRDHPPRWSHLSAERRRRWDAREKRKKRAEQCLRIRGSPSRAVTAGHGGPALPEVGTLPAVGTTRRGGPTYPPNGGDHGMWVRRERIARSNGFACAIRPQGQSRPTAAGQPYL